MCVSICVNLGVVCTCVCKWKYMIRIEVHVCPYDLHVKIFFGAINCI
jgi:hypothetical protein